jgi:hypothetical protein
MVKKALRKRLHRTYWSLTRLKIFTNLATNVNKKSRENRIFMTKVLILDHSKSMRKTLGERLAYEGYAIEATDDVSEASEMCRQMAFDVVLTDDSSNASPLGIPFIVLAGAGDNQIQRAVTAFRDGAMDFLQIPSDINRLYDTLRRYSEEEAPTQTPLPKQRMSAHAMGRARRTRASSVQPIIGSSNAIGNVRQVVERIAAFDTRTLITGENGTGKELVARWLHAKSRRASGPFVEVNCAAIPSELIESELFGHERGAFTSAIKQRKGKFEQATGGTLFMDEIGDMSLAAQAKVLRALQENKICRVGSDKDIDVDVRVIAATNKNLREEIAKGNFREDLYHRLSVIVIRVPPLRERSSDVPELTQHFVDEISSLYGIPPKPIDSDAMEALSAMRWSGNVRELRNVIERLIILSGDTITIDDVHKYCQS